MLLINKIVAFGLTEIRPGTEYAKVQYSLYIQKNVKQQIVLEISANEYAELAGEYRNIRTSVLNTENARIVKHFINE